MELTFEPGDFEKAWPHFVERFAQFFARGECKRDVGHLAIVKADLIPVDRGPKLRDAVIWERSIERDRWDDGAMYHVVARTKAMMSARDRQRNRFTIRGGGSLQIGDSNWCGGVFLNSLGFGFSGVEEEVDELMAAEFMNLARLMARRRNPRTRPDEDFVGGKPHDSLVY